MLYVDFFFVYMRGSKTNSTNPSPSAPSSLALPQDNFNYSKEQKLDIYSNFNDEATEPLLEVTSHFFYCFFFQKLTKK